MNQAHSHPSFLELDRHALGSGAPHTAAHVAQCARCQTHLAEIGKLAPPPAWLGRLSPRPRARSRRTVGFALGGIALAAALCLAVLRSRDLTTNYDGVKGAPSVALHVYRAGRVALWDHEPLLPGDRIRFEVAPEEFGYVSVFAAHGQPAQLSTMYSGRVPSHGRALLPKAWQLDAAPGPERVLVMFAHAEISERAASALMAAHDPKQVWFMWLTLPKSSR